MFHLKEEKQQPQKQEKKKKKNIEPINTEAYITLWQVFFMFLIISAKHVRSRCESYIYKSILTIFKLKLWVQGPG